MRSNEDGLLSESLGESPEESEQADLGEEASKELQPHSSCSSGCQAAGFHRDCGPLVFKPTVGLGTRIWGQGGSKYHAALFLIFSWFSGTSTPSIAVSLWLTSRLLKKVDSGKFYALFALVLWMRLFSERLNPLISSRVSFLP